MDGGRTARVRFTTVVAAGSYAQQKLNKQVLVGTTALKALDSRKPGGPFLDGNVHKTALTLLPD